MKKTIYTTTCFILLFSLFVFAYFSGMFSSDAPCGINFSAHHIHMSPNVCTFSGGVGGATIKNGSIEGPAVDLAQFTVSDSRRSHSITINFKDGLNQIVGLESKTTYLFSNGDFYGSLDSHKLTAGTITVSPDGKSGVAKVDVVDFNLAFEGGITTQGYGPIKSTIALYPSATNYHGASLR